MRLPWILFFLLVATSAQAQLGGDSRFNHLGPVSNDSLLVRLLVKIGDGKTDPDTIEDISGKGNNAIQYGASGTDSSGVSYDPATGLWGIALDGSAGDSTIVTLADSVVSTNNVTASTWYESHQYNRAVFQRIIVLAGKHVTTAVAAALWHRGDTLHFFVNGATEKTRVSFGYTSNHKPEHWFIVKNGNNWVGYCNNDSVIGSATTAMGFSRMIFGRQALGSVNASSGANYGIRLYRRALTTEERARLIAESTDLNARRRFSRY